MDSLKNTFTFLQFYFPIESGYQMSSISVIKERLNQDLCCQWKFVVYWHWPNKTINIYVSDKWLRLRLVNRLHWATGAVFYRPHSRVLGLNMARFCSNKWFLVSSGQFIAIFNSFKTFQTFFSIQSCLFILPTTHWHTTAIAVLLNFLFLGW